MKAGQQPGDDAEGREGKLLEVPWPQVTASEPRPMASYILSWWREVVKAIEGNENSKHLAKMSPWVRRGVCKEGQRREWAYVSAGS